MASGAKGALVPLPGGMRPQFPLPNSDSAPPPSLVSVPRGRARGGAPPGGGTFPPRSLKCCLPIAQGTQRLQIPTNSPPSCRRQRTSPAPGDVVRALRPPSATPATPRSSRGQQQPLPSPGALTCGVHHPLASWKINSPLRLRTSFGLPPRNLGSFPSSFAGVRRLTAPPRSLQPWRHLSGFSTCAGNIFSSPPALSASFGLPPYTLRPSTMCAGNFLSSFPKFPDYCRQSPPDPKGGTRATQTVRVGDFDGGDEFNNFGLYSNHPRFLYPLGPNFGRFPSCSRLVCPLAPKQGARTTHIVRAGDFDGGDDDILEFDAEDGDLENDVDLDDLVAQEDKLFEAGLLEASTIIETSLITADVAGAESAMAGEAGVPGEAMPEDFAIDEDVFHHVPLYSCDFFIRRCADVDDDVYDFSQVYVAPPASSAYSTPTIYGSLPSQPRRCSLSEWAYVTGKTMPFSSDPYQPSAKEINEVTKVFLIRHLEDERGSSPHFVLDFEEIYVLDGNEKSIRRANVRLELPDDQPRNRKHEMLIVRQDGTSFKIIPRETQRHVDDVVSEHYWHQTRESVEGYLRGFRDFESSNWF